jgi:hypothetical protein
VTIVLWTTGGIAVLVIVSGVVLGLVRRRRYRRREIHW